MAFEIFDFRREEHIKNLLVTPHIRSRFLRMQPGEVAGLHSHDLGHEIFLILQGRCVFHIAGSEQELCAGQLCVALADEIHQVRAVGNEPMIMYLSVTPHIQPTHTGRDPDGTRHPTRFQPSNSYDVETDTDTPIDELIDKFTAASSRLSPRRQRPSDRTRRKKRPTQGGSRGRRRSTGHRVARSDMARRVPELQAGLCAS